MIPALRHTLMSAFIVGTAFLITLAPALHAHEDKVPAHESEVMSPANTEAWGAINGLREALASQVAAKNLKPVHEWPNN